MRIKIKIAFIITIVMICTVSKLTYAQWNQTVPNAWRFVQTDKVSTNSDIWIKSVGVGDFTGMGNNEQPRAALHINANYLFPSTGFTVGEVFRTTSDAPAGSDNAWRMYTGTGTPYYRHRFGSIK